MTCKKHLGGTVWAALLVFVSCGSGIVPPELKDTALHQESVPP